MILISIDIMMSEVYPHSMRKLFTNRESELEQLRFFKEELINMQPKNLCILGPRRCGKSMLLKEFVLQNKNDKNMLISYVNIEPLVTTAFDFAVKFVGTINYQLFDHNKNYLDCLSKEALLTSNAPKALKKNLQTLYTELEKAKPSSSYILSLAFSYPKEIAKKTNKKIMLILDEFQEITALKKLKNVGNPLSLFREFFSEERVSYIMAGSVVSLLEEIFSDNTSPLFAQAEKMYLTQFNREATAALTDKLMKIDNSKIKEMIYLYSRGNPFYIYHILKRMRMLHAIQNIPLEPVIVKESFVIETLSVEGKIYDLCDYLYRVSLSKARYYTPLKSILSILSIEEGLNQSQIAKKLKITQGATKEYLNELIKINLIVKKDNTYHFIDPVFRYWIAYVQEGVEIGGYPSEKNLHTLVKELDKKFQQASSELGRAKEYEFKVKLEEKFGVQLNNYVSSDGQQEFDLVGKKDDVYYIVEVKWRNRRVSIKDILEFSKKIQNSFFSDKEKKMLFISKSGFDKKALQEAQKKKIRCLDKNLNKIV